MPTFVFPSTRWTVYIQGIWFLFVSAQGVPKVETWGTRMKDSP